MKIKKGDTVIVLAGDDRGKTGKVLKVFPKKNRVVVEGVNFIKRSTRKSQKTQKGGIIEKEGTINVSNLMLSCPKCSNTTKIAYRDIIGEREGKATRVRICRQCGEII
jgi:large subunit ribosomal protein L24